MVLGDAGDAGDGLGLLPDGDERRGCTRFCREMGEEKVTFQPPKSKPTPNDHQHHQKLKSKPNDRLNSESHETCITQTRPEPMKRSIDQVLLGFRSAAAELGGLSGSEVVSRTGGGGGLGRHG